MKTETKVSLKELIILVDDIDNELEKEGLKAFITNFTEKQDEEKSNLGTFLGKITPTVGGYGDDLSNEKDVLKVLEAMKEDYYVVVE